MARARAIFCTNVKLFTDIPVQVYGSLVVCMNVFRLGWLRASCHNMINSFLTTYRACCICAIFENFASVILGLNGLVLGSDNKTLCFRFEPTRFKPFVSHILVNIFLTYSLWVFPMQWFLFSCLIYSCLSMVLCFFFGPNLDGWSFILGLRWFELFFEHCCLVSY